MKKILLGFIMFALVACGISNSVIQAAIAQTQAAIPTIQPTVNPCPDQGWADIANLLHQFDEQIKNIPTIKYFITASPGSGGITILGPHYKPSFGYINTTIDEINNISIATCTEYARRLIIAGLDYQVSAVQLPSSTLKKQSTYEINSEIFAEGMGMVMDGVAELEKLGITIDYP